MVYTIAAIDVGHRNFALAIEEFTNPIPSRELEDIFSGDLKFFHNADFGSRKVDASLDNAILTAIMDWLTVQKDLLDKCDTVIIEQQMKTNPFAQKIEHMVHAWFLIHYGAKMDVHPFPASHKTRVLKAPKKMTKPERKRWAVDKATEILCGRGDVVGLEIMSGTKKKDDLADVCAMIQAWKVLHIDKLVSEDIKDIPKKRLTGK
jgi:hypothetical protein